jgi:ADP-heptose:LPS heptosyltransferase
MKILVIRFSSIGDIVLTTPVLRCLKKQLPDTEIHFITKYKFRAVTEANPYIDKFFYLKENFTDLISELKNENYDQVIDLHKNFRSCRIVMALGRKTLSFQKLSVEKFLLTKFHMDRMPHRHITDRSLDTVIPLGVFDDGEGLDYFIPSDTSLSQYPLPHIMHSGYIAMVIGASYETKKLPVQRLKELCALLQVPIVLIGGPEDAAAGEEISTLEPDRIYNGCGKYDLHQSALIVRDARVVISHDTGMQYIACAFQKRILAIWGGTSPALQVEPYYGRKNPVRHKNFLLEGLNCQPCSNFGTKKCPRGHFNCMLKLDLKPIAQSAELYWKETL